MLTWARASVAAGGAGGAAPDGGAPSRDLLELYCGNGNFAVALAPLFRRVVATEVSKAAVVAAGRNFELNGVGNAAVGRVSSEEFTAAWQEGRKMHRCAAAPAGSRLAGWGSWVVRGSWEPGWCWVAGCPLRG